LLVLAAAGLLYLSVSVGNRFEGRLWTLPSKVYSTALVLSPGERMATEWLVGRLDRSGYARSAASPSRPGQYRVTGDELAVYLRSFASSKALVPERHVRIRISSAQRIIAISEADGRRLPRVTLEPEPIATLFGLRQEERRPISLEQVPDNFVRAVLAAEDSRFYSHHGLDLRGIARAAWVNVRRQKIVQGGSTITQQTVKNLFLGQERTWSRKLRESLLSIVLDGKFSKDRILEVYLNEVYFGQRGPVAICGAEAASRFYFGRELEHLSIGEWAMLAGLIRSPGSYNPFRHPERARERRDQVLHSMLQLGFVDSASVTAALAEPLELASGRAGSSGSAYAVDFVRRQLAERYPRRVLEEDGLSIYTTIDPRLQLDAELALREGLEKLERDRPAVTRQLDRRRLQGAVVVLRPATGEILALVGGRDYGESQFNRAVQARRQPGSCFKPFVYAAGFELTRAGDPAGLTPATLLDDAPLELIVNGKSWRPQNYDREFRGPVTARVALEQSLNVPTIRAGQQVGLTRVIEVARRLGIESKLAPVPALSLGTSEVTPLELATAYGALAQQGMRATPWTIRAVADAEGLLLEGSEPERVRAVSAESAFLTTDILRGVFSNGTAKSAAALGFNRTAAGKTGTTNQTRDAWFVGYTPELLALVWVGYDDNASTGLTGASGALPIWVDFMNRATGRGRMRGFAQPTEIVRKLIDPETGQLAVPGCPKVSEETFARGSEPNTECREHLGRFKRWLRKWKQRRRDDTSGL